MAIRRDARDAVGRFKPGASGNPRGRPRISTTINSPEAQRDLIYDVAEHKVSVTIDGEKLRLPLIAANLLTLAIQGANGNVAAAKQFIQIANTARSEEIGAIKFMFSEAKASDIFSAHPKDPELLERFESATEELGAYLAGNRERHEGPLRKAARRRK